MYNNEQYKKDLSFVEKYERTVTKKLEFFGYFFSFCACLAAHIMYLIIFAKTQVTIMAVFNIFSVIFYAVAIIGARSVKNRQLFVYATLAEIVVHAAAATVCIGVIPDFCMFLLMIIPLAFLMPNSNKNAPFVVMTVSVLLYGVLRYIYQDPTVSIYKIMDPHVLITLYIVNILAGSFVLIYVATIYTFSNRYKECKLRVQNEKLKIMASTDPLTKLSNRREINRILAEISAKSNESGQKYIVGIGDIDNFKKVNDIYGHDYGDVVLAKTANVLAESVSGHGCVSRWGGEEFLFVLPDTDLEKGLELTNDIVRKVNLQRFKTEKAEFSITITIGLCECLPDDSLDSIISRADARLYKGKHSEKNCVVYTD